MLDVKKPLVLVILDGWGYSSQKIGNPIAIAKTPVMDGLQKKYPMALIQASGPAVGMVWSEAGNSEVGHMNIGAGRIVEQYFSRISRAVDDRSFFSNPALTGAFEHAGKNSSAVHLIGLLTSGTVHAALDYLPALLDLSTRYKHAETYLHFFTDGRDSGLQEGLELITKMDEHIQRIGSGKIATLMGRSFAMDRDSNWDLTQKAYSLLSEGRGELTQNLYNTIQAYYEKGLADYNIPPTVVESSAFSGIQNGDSLVFFNFREDSMRQLARSFVESDFSFFPQKKIENIYICSMTKYIENTEVKVAFAPPLIPNSLAEVLSKSGRTQMRVAETEKYAHISFFFNGLQPAFGGEQDVLIPSNKNYEQNPVMKCQDITVKAIEGINNGQHDLIAINYANPDMLAHTGNFESAVAGIEAVDNCLGHLREQVLANGGILIVTADHGNAESMIYRSSGELETRHDTNPVPFILISTDYETIKDEYRIGQELNETSGILADAAPTILELMGIPVPEEMTGKSLLGLLSQS